ncbi:hemerythrin domain-containing protein [Sphaerisporangium aureirubrum]|uniref:Hemerythrin domain-containing protein n=1 Tax=Sphaerisporangium aureirubrum TaxID=1544736 RepID=A0ABW1NDR8_9ACTN
MTETGHVSEAPGEHLVAELKWIHDMIRRDLRFVHQLAQQVDEGAPVHDIGAAVRSLQTNGPLWQLKVNCLRYCHVVHLHHSLESSTLFPALRRADPALSATVDRLESDHREVADLLTRIETLADHLSEAGDSSATTRHDLVGALTDLRTHLLTHLDFEEEAIGPTLRGWHSWPF